MPIQDDELRAIAFLAQRIRRSTPGAGPWDEHGLMSNLRKLQNRNLHMTTEHVLRHAADPKAKSPGVLLAGFTPAAPSNAGTPHPPKKVDECREHPGQFAGNCATCLTDATRAYHDDDPVDPMPRTAALQAARKALAG